MPRACCCEVDLLDPARHCHFGAPARMLFRCPNPDIDGSEAVPWHTWPDLASKARSWHMVSLDGVMNYRHAVRSTAGMIFCLLALLACELASAAEPKRVMVLHSFGRDFKPWNEYARTIRTELERQSPWPLDIIDHSLMTARSSDEDSEAPFVEYLRALHRQEAARLHREHRRSRGGLRPAASAAVFSPTRRWCSRRWTSVACSLPYSPRTMPSLQSASTYLEAMKNILRVLPDTRNIVVVDRHVSD